MILSKIYLWNNQIYKKKKKNINKISNKIDDLQIKIKNFEDESKNLNPEKLEKN